MSSHAFWEGEDLSGRHTRSLLIEKQRRNFRMLVYLIFFIQFILKPSRAAFSNSIRVEGAGIINDGRTSMDLHVEITKLTKNELSTPPVSSPATEATLLPYHSSNISNNDERISFGTETVDQFIQSALEFHNKFRAIHNAPPLRLNKEMSKEAEDFALQLMQNGINNQPLMHADQLLLRKKNEGENIAAGGGKLGGLTAKGAVKNWYDEVCSYNWKEGGFEPHVAHFMQLIWKGSSELGIGKADGRKNGLPYAYIVARYKPSITLDTVNNVLKGSFNKSYCERDRTSQTDISLQKSLARKKAFGRSLGRTENKVNLFAKMQETFHGPSGNSNPIEIPQYQSNVEYRKQPGHILKGPRRNIGKYGNRVHHGKSGAQIGQIIHYNDRPLASGNNKKGSSAASEYYPKQAEVLEEFIEGDDPERRKFRDSYNAYGATSRPTESLIPVMNSEDAEVADEPTEDDVRKKARVPNLARSSHKH